MKHFDNTALMPRPVRVLMVVRLFYPWIGGAERQAHKLARELRQRGIPVEIVTGWWFRGTPQREIFDGIPVFRNHTLWDMFGIRGLRRFGGYLYLATLLWYLWRRRAHYDVIHVHGLNYHTAPAALAARWFGRQVITKLANSGSASDIQKFRTSQQLPGARLLLPTALRCDRFIATNPTIRQELTAVGVPSENIVELTNGVETDSIRSRSDYALHQPIRLLFVGRLHRQKGLDVLLAGFASLVQQHPRLNLRLQVLGEGPLRESLMRLAFELEIASRVEWVGQTDRVMDYLQQADLFVLPSRAEGISNALLEAMACGLPVVVSKIPGNTDVVEHGRNGLLFAVDDQSSLANALTLLLTRADLRERLGRAARQTVEARFSISFIADRLVALYRWLVFSSEDPARRSPATALPLPVSRRTPDVSSPAHDES